LPDSGNVFNDLIRMYRKAAMPVEIVPQNPGVQTYSEARPRRFDLRALGRLSAWGGAAATALAVAAFASHTETGSQRLATFVSPDRPVQAAAVTIPPPSAQEQEIARLQNQVRTLAADRDRLAERVAGLAQTIEDVTGSIKRQAATPAPQPATAAPAISAPATVDATTEAPSTNAPATVTATPAPPAADPPHDAVPLPPARVAALAPETAPAPKQEIGVALATSTNLEVLHLQWAALKANFGPALAGLRPTAAREQRGTSTVYRLVLGPLPNMAAATKLCARLTAARAVCHTGKFSGDPL
jgi:cytoskeletal protein RodZ